VSFGIYLVGYIILIVGLAMGAHMLNVPQKWIGVGIVCLIGLAIIHGVTATRQKDPAGLDVSPNLKCLRVLWGECRKGIDPLSAPAPQLPDFVTHPTKIERTDGRFDHALTGVECP
jgi:hypothetical protein